jgi:hypothetical protein
VVVPGAGARIPGVGVEVGPGSGVEIGQLGAECCNLAGEVLDVLQKCTDLGEWRNACNSWLGHGLNDVVCAVNHGV